MSTINHLYDVTLQLYSILQTGMPADERDEYLASIDKLLENRQQLIKRLPEAYTEAEKQVGKQILAMNVEIDKLLSEQFADMKTELEQFNKKKQRSQHYANPYRNASVDGMFFDKKK